MSHLAHIVKLKQNLIAEGITNPEVQSAIVQTCYVKALVAVVFANNLDKETFPAFNRWILSYWNDTTPVKGLLVASQVRDFIQRLNVKLSNKLIDNELELDIVEKIGGVDEDKYTGLETYSSVIQTLMDEAQFKLPQFIAAEK